MLLTAWPWLQRQPQPLPSAVWARALSTSRGRLWTPTNVSAAWTDLEQRGLIKRRRLSRGVVVEPRREDGKADYTKPGRVTDDRRHTYFVLPPSFWTEEWFERLTLPGLAMLLVIAGETSDKDEVWLTNEDAAGWYGLSARSVESGIEDLRGHRLLHERVEWIKAPLSAVGATQRHWYQLTGAFSTAARRRLQDTAQQGLEARTGATSTRGKQPARSQTKTTNKTKKRTKRKTKGTTKTTPAVRRRVTRPTTATRSS
jgi:hypothetical protein